MKEVIEKIRVLILKRSNPKAYAEEIGIKRASMYNFLNGKAGINVKTFFKIITPLGLRMAGDEKLTIVDTVWCDGQRLKKGWQYKGKEIMLCFGDSSSSKQCVLLKNEQGEHELVVC